MGNLIRLHGKVRKVTLARVSTLLYGANRSCDPSNTLRSASRAIGRVLTHEDILRGALTEREALVILRKTGPLFPDLRARIKARFAR